MCGIVGFAQSRAAAQPPLDAMVATLCHRGPDDSGTFWSDDRRVGLGHRRLSIIDLSAAGHQPMSDASGDVRLSFNGEIYNYRELRDELAALGHSFRSASDTEVLLAAYAEWGTECLARLDGMFAISLFDLRTKQLLLARDRAGEKPLYFSHRDGRLWFGSELKALMADPGFERRIDPAALEFFLAYGYVPSPLCILRGVEKLQQGEALLYDVDRDSLRRWTYWKLPPAASDTNVDANELVAELESLLEASVRRQLVADVPVGVLLSGGVDSSLVTALAARVSSAPVKTFTISFPGGGSYDEAPFARLVASHFGTDHTELPADPLTIELLPKLARQFDEPLADESILPTYLVSRAIRPHARVALGGDGGDELFGGYDHYSWLMRMERYRTRLPRPARRTLAGAARRLPPGIRGRNHFIGFGDDLGGSIAHINLFFDSFTRSRLLAPLRRTIGAPSPSPESFRASVADPSQSLLRRATETDFRTTMCDGYLVKVDRASMLASLEVRAPFLDRRVIEFAFGRVPDSLKANERERKILPRMLATKLLPPELDTKRKQGFSIPLDDWFRGATGDAVETILAEADPSIFDRDTIRSLMRGQRKGRQNARRLFALTMFELWRREYGVSIA
jgi:asparagine synthase (glutamine-hydrolysing)